MWTIKYVLNFYMDVLVSEYFYKFNWNQIQSYFLLVVVITTIKFNYTIKPSKYL